MAFRVAVRFDIWICEKYAASVGDMMLRRMLQSIRARLPVDDLNDRAASAASGLFAAVSDQPLRLNLGCGDKHLPGYVNVDVAPTRAGKRPDVVCDVRQLKAFADSTVDEVLAVHVVEHFWRWEIVEILREWKRVLKPGGRMVLECPNLLTACEELLKDPLNASQPGRNGQRTMWVFYGDPGWRDPLMCHHWNYTPASLKEVMEEAGFTNVRQEPAQFKLREPRDMRLVGEKATYGQAYEWLASRGSQREDHPAAAAGYVAFVIPWAAMRFYEPSNSYDHRFASTRLRVLIPTRELARITRVAFVPPEDLVSGELERAYGKPLAIVLGKVCTADLRANQELFRELVDWFRECARTPLFADLSDDYSAMAGPLKSSFLEEYQRDLVRRCALTVPCAGLAERLRIWTDRPIHVIEDPWERPQQNPPGFAPGAVVKLCWFGNLGPPLVPHLEMSLSQALDGLRGRPAQLDFVTATEHRRLAIELGARLTQRFPALTFRFIPWSLQAQWDAIDACDLVLLPQDHRADWGSVKSHNRMVEALRAGRLPIASPIPSYCELADYAWVGDDLGGGIDWALAHPEKVVPRVAAGQRHLPQRFAPEVVGRKWAQVLGVA